jgi:hypothetical protein
MVTTNAPSWRDPLLEWRQLPPALGSPHEGFFYPDPLGFWLEVRRWATSLLRVAMPRWTTADALSVSALIHAGDDPDRVRWASERCQPMVTLYLDEAAVQTASIERAGDVFSIPDPYRPGTVYEGWWVRLGDGRVVGKSPQHPASHRLYRAQDIDVFLHASPIRI